MVKKNPPTTTGPGVGQGKTLLVCPLKKKKEEENGIHDVTNKSVGPEGTLRLFHVYWYEYESYAVGGVYKTTPHIIVT